MKPPIILLDADGVCLRSTRPAGYLERHYGLSRSQTVELRQMFDRCVVGKSDLRDEMAHFLKEWRLEDSVEEFLVRAFAGECEFDEQVLATVSTLRSRGVTCGLVTNQDKHRMRYLEESMAIRNHFDHVFVSHEIGLKKPDPAFYRAVEAQLPKGNLMYWDDRLENVEAARACGWTAFHFQNATAFAEEIRSMAINS